MPRIRATYSNKCECAVSRLRTYQSQDLRSVTHHVTVTNSNLGAGVAGAVAETVGRAPLAALARTNVFEPLGMMNSSWLLADYGPGELATRYDVEQCLPFTGLCASTEQPKRNFLIRKIFRPASSDRRLETYPQFGNPNYPDGGVNASARDLALLAQSMLAGGKTRSGHLLSTASFDEMLKLQLPPSIDDRQRFFWRDRNGLIGHAGTEVRAFFPSANFQVAVDSQASCCSTTPISKPFSSVLIDGAKALASC